MTDPNNSLPTSSNLPNLPSSATTTSLLRGSPTSTEENISQRTNLEPCFESLDPSRNACIAVADEKRVNSNHK